jgi:hypothetical protein
VSGSTEANIILLSVLMDKVKRTLQVGPTVGPLYPYKKVVQNYLLFNSGASLSCTGSAGTSPISHTRLFDGRDDDYSSE